MKNCPICGAEVSDRQSLFIPHHATRHQGMRACRNHAETTELLREAEELEPISELVGARKDIPMLLAHLKEKAKADAFFLDRNKEAILGMVRLKTKEYREVAAPQLNSLFALPRKVLLADSEK